MSFLLQACGLAPEDLGGADTETSPSMATHQAAMTASSQEHRFCLETGGGYFVNSQQNSVHAMAKACEGDAVHSLVDANGGRLMRGDIVYVKTSHGTYWSGQSDGRMEANRTQMLGWERFRLTNNSNNQEFQNGDTIGFQSVDHNKWLVAEDDGGREVNVNRNGMGAWETFRLKLVVGVGDPAALYVSNAMKSENAKQTLNTLQQNVQQAKQKWDDAKHKLDELVQRAKHHLGVLCIENRVHQCQQRNECNNVCGNVRVCGFWGCWNVSGNCRSVCRAVNHCAWKSAWDCVVVPRARQAEQAARATYESKKAELERKSQQLKSEAQRRYQETQKHIEDAVKKSVDALNKLKDLGDEQRKKMESTLKSFADKMAHDFLKDAHRKIHSSMRASYQLALAALKKKLQSKWSHLRGVAKSHHSTQRYPLSKRDGVWKSLRNEFSKHGPSIKDRMENFRKTKANRQFAAKALGGTALFLATEAGVALGASFAWAGIQCQHQDSSYQVFEACYVKEFTKAIKYALFDTLVATAYTPLELSVVTPKAVLLASAVTAMAAAAMSPLSAAFVGAIAGIVSKTAVSYAVYEVANQFFQDYEKGLWKQSESFFQTMARDAAKTLY